MWHWNWRSFFRIQVSTAIVLVIVYGVLVFGAFYMASFSAMSTGTKRSLSGVERVAEFLMAVPLSPRETTRGNIPLAGLATALAVNAAFWAIVLSAAWAAVFTALLGFLRRRSERVNTEPSARDE